MKEEKELKDCDISCKRGSGMSFSLIDDIYGKINEKVKKELKKLCEKLYKELKEMCEMNKELSKEEKEILRNTAVYGEGWDLIKPMIIKRIKNRKNKEDSRSHKYVWYCNNCKEPITIDEVYNRGSTIACFHCDSIDLDWIGEEKEGGGGRGLR
ncbi:MAG: hypothetical protein ACOC4M_17115 [Promethearchaeia archaeon]